MSDTLISPFRREILKSNVAAATTDHLQSNLSNMIDLGLLLKQAHWNVVGSNFRSVHLILDEILETVRAGSDDIAERMATIGISPDGRSKEIAENSQLATYPCGFLQVEETLNHVANALMKSVEGLRKSIAELGELDPISEDLLIGISAGLEKHLWMLQAQEA